MRRTPRGNFAVLRGDYDEFSYPECYIAKCGGIPTIQNFTHLNVGVRSGSAVICVEIQYEQETLTVKRGQYPSGHLSLFLEDARGQPMAALSVEVVDADLATNEFILKDYSENQIIIRQITRQLTGAGTIRSTGRFIEVGRCLCPIFEIPALYLGELGEQVCECAD